MAEDAIKMYCRSIGFEPAKRTVLAEGTSDAHLFLLARRLEMRASGIDLFGRDFTIVAAGIGNDGGTTGVLRELSRLKGFSRVVFDENGRQAYRFIGLVDNDAAGRHAVRTSNVLNTDIFEYRDIFRLRPVMPQTRNYDQNAMRSLFESKNAAYRDLDWECEDLLAAPFVTAFVADHPRALRSRTKAADVEHCEWTDEGKSQLSRFVAKYAIHSDLSAAIDAIRSLRSLVGLPPI